MISRLLIFAFISICSVEAMSGNYRQAAQRWYESIRQNLRRVTGVVSQKAHQTKPSPLPAYQSNKVEPITPLELRTVYKDFNGKPRTSPALPSKTSTENPAPATAVGVESFLLDYNHKSQEELKKAIKQKEIEDLDPAETRHNLWNQLQKSISGIHIKKEPGFEKIINDLPLGVQKQLLKAFTKEEQLLQNGYICFYHSQVSSVGAFNDIVNALFFKLLDQRQPDDFRFIKFLRWDFSMSLEDITKIHSETLKYGERWFQLAVNLFIFANKEFGGWYGSTTIDNLLHNSKLMLPYEHIVSQLLLTIGVYNVTDAIDSIEKNKYMRDLKQSVLELDAQVHKNGRLLLIAVPEKEVDNNVFTVIWPKYRDRRTPLNFRGKELYKFSEVFQEIKKEAETIPFEKLHEFECAIPYSHFGLSNPYSGIKVYTIDTQPTSEQALQKLEKVKAEFVDAIISQLKTRGQLEQAKKVVKDHMARLRTLAEHK